MPAQILDGKALAATIQQELATQVAEFLRCQRCDAMPGGRVGRRRCGERSLRSQQAACLPAHRNGKPASSLAGGNKNSRIARSCRSTEQRPGYGPTCPRHPGPNTLAAADRLGCGASRRKSAQRCRCVSSGERRANRAGSSTIFALHSVWHPAVACANRIPIAGQHAVIVGRSDIVGKPMALTAHAARRRGRRDCDGLP